MNRRAVVAAVLALAPASRALAQPAAPVATTDDGYCDFVKGQADATAATLYAPQVFGQFGYIEQSSFGVNPGEDPSDLRLLAGMRYSLSNIYTGMVTKDRAAAECRRHAAVVAMRGVTANRAATARVKIYQQHMAEAARLLQAATADFDARRATLQEVNAMRMRVEQLKSSLADARRELAALPPQNDRPLATLLTEYRSADADVEKHDGKLRTAKAYDISVRAGMDRYLEGANAETRFFGVLQLDINLGAFFTGSGNARAAAGRARYARSGSDPVVASINATVEQLHALIAIDTERATQAKALVAELGHQMESLDRIGTDDAIRLRRTVWFDWVKAQADLAYLNANVAAMQDIVAGHAQAR